MVIAFRKNNASYSKRGKKKERENKEAGL